MNDVKLRELSSVKWQLPKSGDMNVPGVIFASKPLLNNIRGDKTLEQLRNMTQLPGIISHAIALPDAHQGYGFCIGGVAALDYNEGGVSPGGVGYDINCGVRLLRTNLTKADVKPHMKELLDSLFKNVPSGVGSEGKVKVTDQELNEVLSMGAAWAVERGYGWSDDVKHLEEEGCLNPNDPEKVSNKALARGKPQLGSLGAGNHFLEIEFVESIMDNAKANTYGITGEDQVGIMIHCGSRGLGHQVCSDYLQLMEEKHADLIKALPDRELVYAPAHSDICDDYFKAMACAANYAWANRQMITHWVRESFEKVFKRSAEDLGMGIVYDVCHNVAKVEEHKVDGKRVKAYVHRKGATRSFPPGHKAVPVDYRDAGQPVLLPGHMATGSYLLSGTQKAMSESFGSTAHGAGRVLSRHDALRQFRGEEVQRKLESMGVMLKARSWRGVAEEAPGSYKDLDEVARVSHEAGIGEYVARLKPIGVIKG